MNRNPIVDYREKLLKGRESDLWIGYVNMLKMIKRLFVSPNHWVLEFIQNGEDARSKRIALNLEDSLLTIMNDGAPFNDRDFKAICNVNSPKSPSSGHFGYLGIGFKSIFTISECVEVHSGDYRFRFDEKAWPNEDTTRFPWEILPVEASPLSIPKPYTTLFKVFLKSQEIEERIRNFFSDFPSEIILLLKNIEEIKIASKDKSYKISKRVLEEEIMQFGEKRRIVVEKDDSLFHYLVFRKTVKVPDEIRRDKHTHELRRSGISERDIGLIFATDEEGQLNIRRGRIMGVYSFLPVEGEQTGLPFGIFGDFIPNPGRDLINYEAPWNKWIREEIVKFFKEIVEKVFAPHDEWCFFISELRGALEDNDNDNDKDKDKKFWREMCKEINTFINEGPFYLDIDGNRCRKDEFIDFQGEIYNILGRDLGRDLIEKTFKKKLLHPKLKGKFSPPIVDFYDIVKEAPHLLEELRKEPERICKLYREICHLTDYFIRGKGYKEIPLWETPFVLADDGELYKPTEVGIFEIDLEKLPGFLKGLLPEKKILHPLIAKDKEAVAQLKRCRLEYIDTRAILIKLSSIIENIKSRDTLPAGWGLNDLIEATLLLIKENFSFFKPPYLLAKDNTLVAPENLFLEGAHLDWTPLWKEGLLPGFKPLHRGYLEKTNLSRYGLTKERVMDFLRETSIHGFDERKDSKLIEKVAMEKAKDELKKKGHDPRDVSERDRLGYDLECPHCEKVFEIKGMIEPRDIELTESEVRAVGEKGENFILIIVYNIPSEIGYLEISNPARIWRPVEKARIPKENWLG